MKIKDAIGGAAALEVIEAFERKHGRQLPADYKQFLNVYNGGRPERSSRVFVFQTKDGAQSDSLVNWFSGLVERENYSLEKDIQTYHGRIPEHTMPIACDPFGNLILIAFKESGRDGLWFWDHENEPANFGETGLYRIADNFTAFVESLTPLPD